MPIKTNRMTCFLLVLSALSVSVFLSDGRVQGQDTPAPKAQKRLTPEQRAAEKQKAAELQNQMAKMRQKSFGLLPEGDSSEIGKRYQAAFDRFRDAAVELNQVQLKFHLTTNLSDEFKKNITDQWQAAVHQGQIAKEEWLKVAAETFNSDPEKYSQIGDTLCSMMLSDVELDRLDGWLEAAKAVVNSKKFESEEVLLGACLIAYSNADFEFTEECLKRSEAIPSGSDKKPRFINDVNRAREKWEREVEIRKKEAEKNDNPRVEFLTTKGRMVLELYEDSAPESVKSFIYLVERGFYDRKSFFRVEKHLVAQTGCEQGDGTGDAGYRIVRESELPGHRDHFRGSVAIALGTDKSGNIMPETGSSQIYFCFLPMSQLDGSYTVFGRVIEGQETMNHLRLLNLADPEQKKAGKAPDFVVSAKVLRKRSTEYKPQITSGKLPR